MSKSTDDGSLSFPTLTPSQRLHLEVNGFVLLKELICRERVSTMRDTVYEIEAQ